MTDFTIRAYQAPAFLGRTGDHAIPMGTRFTKAILLAGSNSDLGRALVTIRDKELAVQLVSAEAYGQSLAQVEPGLTAAVELEGADLSWLIETVTKMPERHLLVLRDS